MSLAEINMQVIEHANRQALAEAEWIALAACPGPEPFNGTPCCEPHEIAETRAIVEQHKGEWRKMASLSGTHPDDMRGFMEERVSLTWHARGRIRVGEGARVVKKMPSLYVYDPATMHRGAEQRIKGGARYTSTVTPGCEWVEAGEGRATEKLDGTACLVRGGRLFRRYDAKHGKTPPQDFEPAQPEPDPKTGHWPGWIPVGDGPQDQWHRLAWGSGEGLFDGTYELVGPKLQTNPHGLTEHFLVRHGTSLTFMDWLPDGIDIAISGQVGPRSRVDIESFLSAWVIEGLVFHHPDGRMCKVTRAGFGLDWPAAR